MKKSLILVPLAVAILLGISPSKATNPQVKPAVVVLSSTERSLQGDNGNGTGSWAYVGFFVLNSSSSSNAPVFRNTVYAWSSNRTYDDWSATSLAQAMADLVEAGFRLDKTTQDGKYIWIKP